MQSMKHWLAISLLLVPLSWSVAATDDFGHARNLAGILPLPEIFGKEPCDHYTPQDVAVFQSANSLTPIGQIHVAKPLTYFPSGAGCEGLAVTVLIDEPEKSQQALPTLEFSYENPGAIVIKQEGEWFEIVLEQGTGWVHVRDTTRYLPVEKLLMDSLSYLRTQSQPTLFKKPARGEALWSVDKTTRSSLPVEVLGYQQVAGVLWLQVKLLEKEPCTDEPANVAPFTGWLPFLDASGMPVIWFYSRGC